MADGLNESRLRFDHGHHCRHLVDPLRRLGTLTGLGVGTLVSAMLVGRFVNFFNRRVFFIERLARLSLDDETKAARALSKEVQS